MPAQAGIQSDTPMDARLRGHDDAAMRRALMERHTKCWNSDHEWRHPGRSLCHPESSTPVILSVGPVILSVGPVILSVGPVILSVGPVILSD